MRFLYILFHASVTLLIPLFLSLLMMPSFFAALVCIWSICSVFVLSAAQAPDACPQGSIRKGTTCEKCPPGTYAGFRSSDGCIKCRPGTFNPYAGGFAVEYCRQCPNTAFSGAGATECKPCPPNSISSGSKCVTCPLGTALDFKGNCTPCDPGSFSSSSGPERCQPCPDGLTSPRGAKSISECKPCPPGLGASASSGGRCDVCDRRFILPGPGKPCTKCPFGSVPKRTKKQTLSSTTCKPCTKNAIPEAGFFCRKCPPGTETNAPGATYCKTIGSIECPKNFYKTSTGNCLTCPRGMRLLEDKDTCEDCPEGTISPGATITKCTSCPEGMMPNPDQSRCICGPGFPANASGECKPCPPGTSFDSYDGKCFECFEGSISPNTGGECQSCPFGSTSNKKRGGTACVPCPPGFMPPFFESSGECVLISTACPPGMRRDVIDGFLSECKRVDCQADTPPEEIGKNCISCEPGERLIRSGKCVSCPRNAVSDGGLSGVCTMCPNGLLRNPFKKSECHCIGESLRGRGLMDGMCKKCPEGTYSPFNKGLCMLCPAGRFTDSTGNEFCSGCPLGTFSDVEGAPFCKKCPDGFVPDAPFMATHCVRAA